MPSLLGFQEVQDGRIRNTIGWDDRRKAAVTSAGVEFWFEPRSLIVIMTKVDGGLEFISCHGVRRL
jgi:hypothetical protein